MQLGFLTRYSLVGLSISLGFLSWLPVALFAATIVVTNSADQGPGSLREAINAANSDLTPTVITFDPSIFPASIDVGSTTGNPLPQLTEEGTVIDGAGNGVVLDGSSLGGIEDGFLVRASDTTIMDLTIQDFPRDGIRVVPLEGVAEATGVVIEDNTVQFNEKDGIAVFGGRDGNTVEVVIAGNTVFQNEDDAIIVHGSVSTGAGGNVVEALIEKNRIEGNLGTSNITGDGIRVIGGVSQNAGGNDVTAFIDKNHVDHSGDNGIIVKGAVTPQSAVPPLRTHTSNNTVYAEITDNHVNNSGNSNNGGAAIVVSGGHRRDVPGGVNNTVEFYVSKNHVRKTTGHGILIRGGGGTVDPRGGGHLVMGTVHQNHVRESDSEGVFADIASGILVNGGRGAITNTVDVEIEKNHSMRNEGDGIRVVAGRAVSDHNVFLSGIIDNHAQQNDENGIFIGQNVNNEGGGVSPSPIEGNNATQNGVDGIFVSSLSLSYELSDNHANKNGDDGIKAIGNVDGGGNVASANAACNTPGCF